MATALQMLGSVRSSGRLRFVARRSFYGVNAAWHSTRQFVSGFSMWESGVGCRGVGGKVPVLVEIAGLSDRKWKQVYTKANLCCTRADSNHMHNNSLLL